MVAFIPGGMGACEVSRRGEIWADFRVNRSLLGTGGSVETRTEAVTVIQVREMGAGAGWQPCRWEKRPLYSE